MIVLVCPRSDDEKEENPVQILRDIIDSLAADAPVKEVRRGVSLTLVKSAFWGISSTMSRDYRADEEESGSVKPFTDMTGRQLAEHALSARLSLASLGLAAINSLIEIREEQCVDVDGIDLVRDMAAGKNISVVGHFPFLQRLREVARNLWIIEKHPHPGDLPEDASREYLPQSDVVVITATTLINHTLPGLLSLCPRGSMKMLLGPTTSMSPVLFDHGIDVLSGSMVVDEKEALRVVSEDNCFAQLKRSGAVKFVTMLKDKALHPRATTIAFE